MEKIKDFNNQNTPYYKDAIVSYNEKYYKSVGLINKAFPGDMKAIKINVRL